MEVARAFFALPASKGFLLAGGAALLARHLTARPTEDLDFFTAPERGHVSAVRDALEAAARQRGWATERIHDSGTFCRMVIRSADHGVLVDLAVNTPPDLAPSVTPAGPTLAPEELVGHKFLALFDWAAARDFADVYVLTAAAARELKEETGLTVDPAALKVAGIIHGAWGVEAPNGFPTVIFAARVWDGEPVNAEPRKHAQVAWFPVDRIPAALVPDRREALVAYLRSPSEPVVSTDGF